MLYDERYTYVGLQTNILRDRLFLNSGHALKMSRLGTTKDNLEECVDCVELI